MTPDMENTEGFNTASWSAAGSTPTSCGNTSHALITSVVVMRRHRNANQKLNQHQSQQEKDAKSFEEFNRNPYIRVAEEENVDL